MAQAIWNGKVITESNDIVQVVDAIYFSIESVNCEYLKPSETKIICFWKGIKIHP
ncbi:MAG: DUF427 domain-containing protein [Bacteroidales bacterium]|nr:DUF427 domain-containing protein [Bacteroidales bacterium]